MKGRVLAVACAALCVVGLSPSPSRAQSAGAILGGVLGGVIAGSIAAHAVRQRPVVVYARPHRTVRVVREARHAPRARVVRAHARPMTPAASPQGAAVINASSDPFASSRGSGTTPVGQSR